MSVTNYKELHKHIGHKISIVVYGSKDHESENVSCECETCNEVLIDFDNEDVKE